MPRSLALTVLPLVAAMAIAPAGLTAPAKPPQADPRACRTLLPAYPEARLAAARSHQQAGRLAEARAAALEAASAFDAQVELHKQLSDVVSTYELMRAERGAARRAAIARDEAFFLAAEVARAQGDLDAAVRHYALVVQSQPEQPLGQRALSALAALGFLASPLPSPAPASPTPTESPRP